MSSYEIRRWILDRLSEKSTWAGIASIASLFGIILAPDQLELVGAGIIALASLFGIATKEA